VPGFSANHTLLAVAFFVTLAGARGVATAGENPGPVTLESGWSYRWGDSPVDEAGNRSWLLDRSPAGWTEMERPGDSPDRGSNEWLWYRIELPSETFARPALYLPNVILSFEVYLEQELIYRFGAMRPDDGSKYAVTEIHVIPLPPGYEGKTVSVRIFSDVFAIGMDQTADSPLLGAEREVIRRIFLGGLESVAVGFLLIFAGLFALLTIVIRFRENLSAPLSFAAFSICMGVFVMMVHSSAQLVIESQVIKLYAMTVSFLFFPVGMFAYLQHTIFRAAGRTSRRVIWVVFYVHLAAAVTAVALDLSGWAAIPLGMRPYNVLFAVTVPVTLAVTIGQARRGSSAAKVAAWGFILFGLTGFADLLQGLQLISHVRWVSHWGALVFVGCLGYILERQFTESHRRLKVYSRQLQEKSDQLEEYSRTLEEKVADRTRTLDEKNRELEYALQELKDTQEQLIIREKMASLGSLVAGVAHEVNNPIGAVISASDVANRCVGAVRDFVRENTEADSSRVCSASDILEENIRVISEAARRVSEIVRSLKNFARLDEAEFQKADIHEGIDSTLTLVKHLVKDRIEIVREYGDIPDLLVYPNQLNQVFMNLIVNAIDAIEGRGTVAIRTSSDGQNARICIEDTGKGISPEHIRRVFDPGFTTKGVGVGTGLGLSISYNIIRKHGGTIDVKSEPGRSTCFTITLPLRRAGGETGTPDP
jgi:signal transduction histidine kinase